MSVSRPSPRWRDDWPTFTGKISQAHLAGILSSLHLGDLYPEAEIVVSGTGFGTGTSSSDQALEEYIRPDLVFHIGCGTGILPSSPGSWAAVQVVIGVDFDPVAVKVIGKYRASIIIWKIKLKSREGNFLDVIAEDEKAEIIVANILAEAINELGSIIKPLLEGRG